MRLGCLIPLLTVGLLVAGGQGIFTGVTSREPKDYDIDTYLATRPSTKWVRITGCVIDLALSTYKTGIADSPPREIYVPLRSKQEQHGDKIRVLMATKNPAMLDSIEKTRKMSEGEKAQYALDHLHDWLATRDIEGLVRFGIASEDKLEKKLRAAHGNLADDFVIIDEGKEPDLILSSGMFVFGLLLAGWQLRRWSGSSSDQPPKLTPPVPPPPSEPPLRQS